MPTPQIPANAVDAGPMLLSPRTTYLVGTAADIRPGRGVKLDANEKLVVCAADDINGVGVVTGVNFTNPEWDGTSNPAADDELEVVLKLPGAAFRGRVATDLSAATEWGKAVKWGATGTLTVLPVTGTVEDAKRKVAYIIRGADGSGSEADVLAVFA